MHAVRHLILTLLFGCFIALPANAQFAIEVIKPVTDGSCDGSLQAVVDESGGPYTYAWSWTPAGTSHPASNSNSLSNICQGTYTLVITDAGGCTVMLTYAFYDPNSCDQLENHDFQEFIVPDCRSTKEFDGWILLDSTTNFSFIWDDGTTGPIRSGLRFGSYCVTITQNTGKVCSITNCYTVVGTTNCTIKSPGKSLPKHLPLIVNELSNGPTGTEEYVELLVVGDENCGPLDLRGYRLDDNDGIFSRMKDGRGTGIAQGYFRFSDELAWAEVPSGSLVLIYNSGAKNPAIQLADDPYDENGDGVYVIPSGSKYFESGSSATRSNGLPDRQETVAAQWELINFYDGADAVQVRDPEGNYLHGFSYGGTDKMTGGPDDLHLSSYEGIASYLAFTGSDPLIQTDYSVGKVATGGETLGLANGAGNAAFIRNLCGDSADGSVEPVELGASIEAVEVFPNPFRKTVSLEITAEEATEGRVSLRDLTGKTVHEWRIIINEGKTALTLKTNGRAIPPGLYLLTAEAPNGELLFSTKLVKTN